MAYLNVREHRIEAKIACVGPTPAGVATIVDLLQRASDDVRVSSDPASDTIALAWHPTDRGRFRDCDVLVSVVAPRADASARFEDLLRDADGVVFVPDAHPEAEAMNEASLSEVRAFLARAERASVPVVVHDAAGPEALATLEVTLGEILAAMEKSPAPAEAAGEGDDAAHPLLDALRRVLRETVREHLVDVRAELVVIRAALERSELAAAAHAADARARAETAFEDTDARIRELQSSVDALRAESGKSLSRAAERARAVQTRLDDLVDELKRVKKSWFA
ncbi:MAG: hypothetical protein KF819_06895 [Labilithrix sp.]|nr:hypothetical protein [Labilithrix sp.]